MKGLFCPACGGRHGKSLFSLVGSSKFSPIECCKCGSNFHFASWLWLLLIPIALPIGLVGGTSVGFTAAFLMLYLLGWLAIASSSAPKQGPKFG